MRLNLVGLVVKNETLLLENKHMIKLIKDREADKSNVGRMNNKNGTLNTKVKASGNRGRFRAGKLEIFEGNEWC